MNTFISSGDVLLKLAMALNDLQAALSVRKRHRAGRKRVITACSIGMAIVVVIFWQFRADVNRPPMQRVFSHGYTLQHIDWEEHPLPPAGGASVFDCQDDFNMVFLDPKDPATKTFILSAQSMDRVLHIFPCTTPHSLQRALPSRHALPKPCFRC